VEGLALLMKGMACVGLIEIRAALWGNRKTSQKKKEERKKEKEVCMHGNFKMQEVRGFHGT
jgi:hypothetical protein